MLIFWATLVALAVFLAGFLLLSKLRIYGQHVEASIRTTQSLVTDTGTGIKMLGFYSKPVVRDHFAALTNPTSDDPRDIKVSYGLSRMIGAITPAFSAAQNSDTVVCTVALGTDYRKRVALCLDSHRRFATSRNIALCVLDERPPSMGRPAAWMKIPLIAKLLIAGYKRVLFIDADAMVTNPDFSIEDIFAKLAETKCPVLVTEDEGGINTGVMFVQNISAAYRLLDLIWLNDSDINNGTWEQNSLKVLMDVSNEIRSLVAIEDDPKKINSFPVERRLFHPTRERQIWSYGDFICHFSGLRTPHLERYIENYATSLRRRANDASAHSQPATAPQG